MSINRHSIIFSFSLFFFVLLVAINILLYLQDRDRDRSDHERRFEHLKRAELHEKGHQASRLQDLGLALSDIDQNRLLTNGRSLVSRMGSQLLRYEGHLYFLECHPPRPPMMEHHDHFGKPPPPPSLDDRMGHHEHFEKPPPHEEECVVYRVEDEETDFVFWPFLIGIDLLLVLSYLLLIRRLMPLRRLRESLQQLGERDDASLKLDITGQDEIAEIATAYNSSLDKIRSLREARQLFLRNILHELKTPIMKARLMSDGVEDIDKRKRMQMVFERMEFLLREFSNIEKFSSGEWTLTFKTYRLIDLLDHVCDMLLCTKDDLIVTPMEHAATLQVDFEFFSIALKNLLDNALKYGSDKTHIQIDERKISVISQGDAIEALRFDHPFNRTYENSEGGLGLGLYITNAILVKHSFGLHYEHREGKNVFVIRL